MIETFEKWYASLNGANQKELLDYIYNEKIKSLNEGLFTGPYQELKKGLFTGPINSKNLCKTCGKPL